MTRTFAAVSVLAAAMSAASAADLPVKAIAPPPPGWAGSYGGIVGGFGTGQSSQSDPGSVPLPQAILILADGRYTLSGGLLGGTLGYNWQRGGWVYGIEGDFSWANLSGWSGICGAATATPRPCGTSLQALGTLRGRVGHVAGAGNDWLFYATGGVAVGDVRAWDALGPGVGQDWRAGWILGGGVEKVLAPNWTAKLEYLHVDFGSGQVFNVSPGVPESVSLTADIIRAGVSYRLGTSGTALRPMAKTPVQGGWEGWYVGVNAGYVDGATRMDSDGAVIATSTSPGTAPAMAAAATGTLSTGNGGFIGGAQAGYNFMLSPTFLAGFEFDIQASSLRGSASGANAVPVATVFGPGTGLFTAGITASRGLDYIGTVRGRLGAAITPSLLLYLTGGLAYGGVKSSTSITQTTAIVGVPTVSTAGSFSANRAGYAVGAGGEWMFLGKWSIKGEYLYYDLGSAYYGTGGYGVDEGPSNLPGFGVAGIGTSTRVRFDGNIARIGLNYHLN